MTIRLHLDTDRPAIARAVAALRRTLDGTFLDLTDHERADAEDLLDMLTSQAESWDDDHLDDLGPPADGGTRITTEHARLAWREAAAQFAFGYRVEGPPPVRVRVVMDFAPLASEPTASTVLRPTEPAPPGDDDCEGP